jgi:hypothetical protein
VNVRRLGFTGSRKGMTPEQKQVFFELVFKMKPEEFHHGDCIGCDENAHYQVRRVSAQTGHKIWIVGHIPEKEKTRAFCKVDERREPYDYITRDHHIVDETELLVACPDDFIEVVRSGTWTTVRYARTLERPIKIIRPDGSIKEENHGSN